MDHRVVPNIDPDMACAWRVIRTLKENQVAWPGLGWRNIDAQIAQSICRLAPYVPTIAAMVDDPGDKSGAIETGPGR